MDKKNFFEKAMVSAELLANRTGIAATKAADAAGRTATSVVGATKLNLQIFDLNTEIEILYKEIGKMVYNVHTGQDEDQDSLNAKLILIDEKRDKIEEIRAQLNAAKSKVCCPNCGRECTKDAVFCSCCGAQL
ncbi:MAG: zinc ribbon domain-containing protein [Clostridia bacterium]|nr:zinc ribbon domain-containing protein [Clostridia bacterium]